MKHTPGPWRVGDAGGTVFGPKTQAPVPKIVAIVTRKPIVSDENHANARLIATAPELLEACQSLKRLAWTNKPDEMSLELRAVINQVCDAIAKAEGK